MRSGRSWPSSRRERSNLRARLRLEEAPSSLCPHCGRVSKTVDGMCADCWGVKEPGRAKRWHLLERRKPPLGLGWVEPLDLLWALGALVLVALVAVYAVSRWI